MFVDCIEMPHNSHFSRSNFAQDHGFGLHAIMPAMASKTEELELLKWKGRHREMGDEIAIIA